MGASHHEIVAPDLVLCSKAAMGQLENLTDLESDRSRLT